MKAYCRHNYQVCPFCVQDAAAPPRADAEALLLELVEATNALYTALDADDFALQDRRNRAMVNAEAYFAAKDAP